MKTQTRWEKAIRTIRMRPLLQELNLSEIVEKVVEIEEACGEVQWFVEQGDESFLNALDGDDDAAWEFRMMFSDLTGKTDELYAALRDVQRTLEPKDFDDCIVGLLGNRYKPMFGIYDEGRESEDYQSLTGFAADCAETDAGKRLMRLTKKDMLARIGQCLGIVLAYSDLNMQYESLNSTFEIIRGDNMTYLKLIREIDEAYLKAEKASDGFRYQWQPECKAFDSLLENLPDRAWLE